MAAHKKSSANGSTHSCGIHLQQQLLALNCHWIASGGSNLQLFASSIPFHIWHGHLQTEPFSDIDSFQHFCCQLGYFSETWCPFWLNTVQGIFTYQPLMPLCQFQYFHDQILIILLSNKLAYLFGSDQLDWHLRLSTCRFLVTTCYIDWFMWENTRKMAEIKLTSFLVVHSLLSSHFHCLFSNMIWVSSTLSILLKFGVMYGVLFFLLSGRLVTTMHALPSLS